MDVTKIGNKIRERRVELKLTQKELAQALSISNQLVSKWETGESVPSLEYFDALCRALEVDFTFFADDGSKPEAQSEAEPEVEPEQKPVKSARRAPKINLKLIIIIACSAFGALLITAVTLLSYYVFVPMANKSRYDEEIELAFEKYFARGYYDITLKSQTDGDDDPDVIYRGSIEADGKLSFYSSDNEMTFKDGVLTYGKRTTEKYRAELPEFVTDLDALLEWQMNGEEDKDSEWDYIRYLRRTANGFYVELDEKLITDEMDGSQKKNIRFLDKIRGEVIIEDGMISSMSITVKFRNEPDNENFTVVSGYEFGLDKPVIEHENLEGREWNVWAHELVPRSDKLVSNSSFMASLGAKRAKNQTEDIYTKLVNGKLKSGGNYLYTVGEREIALYNAGDLSLKNTYSFDQTVDDVYIYSDKLYYSHYSDYFISVLYSIDLNSGLKTRMFEFWGGYNGIRYNGKYCWFVTSGYAGYCAVNLETGAEHYKTSGSGDTVKFVDNSGNVYTEAALLKVYMGGKGEGTVLKGQSYYSIGGNLVSNGDAVYTFEGNRVHIYEKGVYQRTLQGDYFVACGGYISPDGWYCIVDEYGFVKIYNDDGSVKDAVTAVSLLSGVGGEYEVCTGTSILCAYGNTLVVQVGDFVARYSVKDLSKPICYTQMSFNDNYSSDFKAFNLGGVKVFAVKSGSGYELWVL